MHVETRNELFRQGYLMGLKKGKQIISESMSYPDNGAEELQGEMLDGMTSETDVDGVINDVVSEAAGEDVYEGTEYDRACELTEMIDSNNPAALSSALEETTFAINAFDNWNRTPLITAAANGNLECLNILLSYDDIIDINVADRIGNTALIEAIDKNHSDCVEALLKAGADPNTCKNLGRVHTGSEEIVLTPLEYAEDTTKRYDDDTCEILVKQYGGKTSAELGYYN